MGTKMISWKLSWVDGHIVSSEFSGLISDWWLRSLHGDPRFEELARKVGFPEVSQAISKSR